MERLGFLEGEEGTEEDAEMLHSHKKPPHLFLKVFCWGLDGLASFFDC